MLDVAFHGAPIQASNPGNRLVGTELLMQAATVAGQQASRVKRPQPHLGQPAMFSGIMPAPRDIGHIGSVEDNPPHGLLQFTHIKYIY